MDDLAPTWRYVADGKARHALRHASDCASRCGVYVISSAFWMGTGSQRESETCAALPACRNCLRLLGRDAG